MYGKIATCRGSESKDVALGSGIIKSQDQATLLLLLLGKKSGTSGVLKDFTNAVVGLGRALEILVGTNLLADLLSLNGFVSESQRDGRHDAASAQVEHVGKISPAQE